MQGVVALGALARDWASNGTIPEADWGRMKTLEFQEALRARARLLDLIKAPACVLCGEFDHHVRLS